MPHLTASALLDDPEGLAFLRSVLAPDAPGRPALSASGSAEPVVAISPCPPNVGAHLAPSDPAPPVRGACATPHPPAARERTMRLSRPSAALVLAGALAGLIFVSPALSSRGPVDEIDVHSVRPPLASKQRASKPAPRVAQAGSSCAKLRRSLFVQGQGWVVRSVSTCR